MTDLRSAFIQAAIGENYEPRSNAEAIFAAAIWQFKKAGGTYEDYLRVGTAFFPEMPGVGHPGLVEDDCSKNADTGHTHADEGHPPPVPEDHVARAPIGSPTPGGDQLPRVSNDQKECVPARSFIPGGGHLERAQQGLSATASTGTATASGDHIARVSNDPMSRVPVGAPQTGGAGQRTYVPQDPAVYAPAAGSENVDGESQIGAVQQDHSPGASSVHVREHDRKAPRPQLRLPTPEQKEAAKRVGRNLVVGAYQLKSRRSKRHERIKDQPSLRNKALKKAGTTMNKVVMPNLTDACLCQRIYDDHSANPANRVSEVMDAITFNKEAEAAYLDATSLVIKSMQTIEQQITKGR